MSTDSKNQFSKIKKSHEPRSRPVGPKSKPAVVRPPRRCIGGALAHAAVEPKEAVIIELSGPDLGPAPWSHHRRGSVSKEAIARAEGGHCPAGRLDEEGLLGADLLNVELDGEGLLGVDLLGTSRAYSAQSSMERACSAQTCSTWTSSLRAALR
jgi:hypothetical protein